MKIKSKLYKILFIFLFVITFHSYSKCQPGCVSIDAGQDTLIPMGNCMTLVASVQGTSMTTCYTVASIPYSPPGSFNAGTQILNFTNKWSSSITLPFTFCFFGNIYNNLSVGMNGALKFSTGTSLYPEIFTVTIPNDTLPGGSIFCPYRDLNPSVAGGIYYSIIGNYPCRQFIASWDSVASDSCTTLLATQEVVINETTNIIEIYIQNSPSCTLLNNGNAVIGIQNANGALGYAPPNRNTSQWSATNEAWRFSPNGLPNYIVSWWQNLTQISPVGVSTPSMTVCPISTTTYTAEVVYNGCSGTQVTISDTVTVYTGFMGINENLINNSTAIYPNPATDNITIETPQQSTIEISNIQGQLIKTLVASSIKTNIDVSALPSGVYVVQVKTEKGIVVRKFVKE